MILQEWRNSSFGERRRLLKILLKFIIENQEIICRCGMYRCICTRTSTQPQGCLNS